MDETTKETTDLPHNIEAEQQLLGAFLVDNENIHRVTNLEASDFFDPVHAAIFEAIKRRVSKEHLASPVTIKSDLDSHEGLKELGGAAYLVRMAGSSVSSSQAPHYARLITEQARKREMIDLLANAREKIMEPDGYDEARSMLEVSLASLPDSEGRENATSFLKAITEAIREIGDAYQGGKPSLSTGFRDLDRALGGFWKGDYIVVAGRPSMGKTSLALSLGMNAATAGKRVVIASREMTESSLAQRALGSLASVKYSDARMGDINETEFRRIIEKGKGASDLPVSILPRHVRDVPAIMSAAKSERARMGGLDLVIIDYLQLLKAAGRDRVQQMTEVSIQIKTMASILDVPVIVVSQLSRGVESREDKRPMMMDLRETGQIEQDADVILFCYRDHYYLTREGIPNDPVKAENWRTAMQESQNLMEVIIAKQRMGGIETVKLGCAIAHNRFWDLPVQEEIGL